MRIAIVGHLYYPANNGQSVFTIHLAEGLARAGHEVHVLASNSAWKTVEDEINGVRVHHLAALRFRWLHPSAVLPFFPSWSVRRFFKECPPDIVHIQDHAFICRDAAVEAQRRGIPVVGTNHFLPENLLPFIAWLPVPRQIKVKVMWGMMLNVFNRLDAVTTPTETAARILRGQKIRLPVMPVSCGVDTCRFCPIPGLDRAGMRRSYGLDPDRALFLYVGRLDSEKRIDLLLRALASLRDTGRNAGRDDIQIAIAGQGSAEVGLRRLAHGLGLEELVKFLGFIPGEQLPALYRSADIFCMPSPEELQSIATLEAMASGLPVLAANARALTELVRHAENGYLFAPGQVDDVACGMAALVDGRADWPRMGAVSRASSEAHSLENTIHSYAAIYQRLVEDRRSQAGWH